MADRPCKLGADIAWQRYYQISLCASVFFFFAHPDYYLRRNARERDTECGAHRRNSFEQIVQIIQAV